MVNTQQFASRLEKIIEYYDLSAAAFADKIEVGRSSISHILSGRNKPSLDFVMKVITKFPEVELYWLLNGKGKFPKEKDSSPSVSSKPEVQSTASRNTDPELQNIIPPVKQNGREIRKIVIFYSDGTFEAFEN